MPMTRRATLALPLLLLARPAGADLPPDDLAAVREVEAYLNGVTTLQADFSQKNADGSTAGGRLFLDRTRGGMRFDYAPPSKILLIATDWRLIFYDGSTKQVNVIPLAQTPLGFLLDEKVALAGDITVRRVERRGRQVVIDFVRTKYPDGGSLAALFATGPTELQGWIVTDPQGIRTQVALRNEQAGMPLDRSLFVWRDPKMFGYPPDD